jgi:hypothetical protein
LRVFSLTKIYSKYIKNVGIKLASLKSMFQYESNDTNFTQYNQVLELVWLPSFGARIKEFIYDSNNYLFGCHGIGYGIHLEFYGFSFHA